MDNFDLRKYLAEGKLFEQERYRKVTDDDQGLDGVFYVEEDGYFVDLDYGKYKSATKDLLDLAMEQGHEYESVENYYEYADHFENELKDYAEGEEVPDWQMNDLAVKYGTDYSQFYGEEEDEDDDEDVYENTIKEAINLDIEDDIAILSGDSGEYEGEIEDGKASFSVIYDDLDYRITDQYDENNIKDFLGKGHAFVELAKKYDYNWDIEPDLVGITIKLK